MSKLPYLDFAEIYPLADIEQIAQMLNLKLRGSRTMRCECPVHGGDERTLCVTPGIEHKLSGSQGVWFCQKEQKGGDRIGLVAHVLEMGQQEAAYFIREQFGKGTVDRIGNSNCHGNSSLPITKRDAPPPPTFDPEKFASRLVWSDEVAALKLTEEEASRLGVGFHPQQKHVYFPIRSPDGSISAFIGVKDGRVKLPPQWLTTGGNVVKLRRA